MCAGGGSEVGVPIIYPKDCIPNYRDPYSRWEADFLVFPRQSVTDRRSGISVGGGSQNKVACGNLGMRKDYECMIWARKGSLSPKALRSPTPNPVSKAGNVDP